MGQESNLISEFESDRRVDGGYLEESRAKRLMTGIRLMYTSHMTGQSMEELREIEAGEEEMRQIEQK